MSMPATYKPSPLGYGSPRSSPFRRPESPTSPSVAAVASSPLRQTTPSTSPTKPAAATPSRFAPDPTTPTSSSRNWTPRAQQPRTPTTANTNNHSRQTSVNSINNNFNMAESPRPLFYTSPAKTAAAAPAFNGNALSQLQPAQVRMLREGFEILDRDSDGVVNREDVADMLAQLGLPADPADVSRFFPPSAPQTTTMAAFLNTLASMLAALSPQAELLSAFSAFDDDDSGEINLHELRDALLKTTPEPGERALTPAEVDKVIEGFAGRKAFNKSMQGGLGKRGEVFRYQEFVNSVMSSNTHSEPPTAEGSEN